MSGESGSQPLPGAGLRAVVAGGGTAGHIEPALAVAEALRSRGVDTIALGTPKGLEKEIVPARGFELKMIDPVPVPRKLSMDLLRLPRNLRRTIRQARKVLRDHRADVLIGFGGYVSAPGYLAAKSLGIPFIVHEANATAGMANKLGVRLGGQGFNAVSGSGLKGEVVGIPLREAISTMTDHDRAVARGRGIELFGLDPRKKTVLVTGGSQGARSLNDAVAGAVERLTAAGYQVLHAYGKKNDAPSERPGYVAVPYIEDMMAAYAIADLIVCRSGAMTVAEVTAMGVPAVYVPLPHGNGEQEKNARDVLAAGAAELIKDADFGPDALVQVVDKLVGDPDKLAAMRAALQGHHSKDVAGFIADVAIAKAKNEDDNSGSERNGE